ncbi:class I SAM-dependent methyltransferase [Actinomadura logoneensis]|uniref:Class I SAM-dependent methyltransferase n=1 Tax=Actinomadura logoneensis TaxID=2293572 RepID=A0A372JDI4_9ACTN|nr:class I SAM-dependent methyltransferase [Actinomadura logoneensis]RFU37448.1 class I SAM-dependent methyltransferase [Actinomadura logoneensis]
MANAEGRGGHPLFARCYARMIPLLDQRLAPTRADLLRGLRGEVIEVGAGTGSTFPYYPAEVARVLAVEPEPRLREAAEDAARRASPQVEIVAGTAERLPAADASFDAAVTSLVLCSVPDQAAALAELRRVLRPGGELRFFEHVRAATAGRRRVQKVLDATVWPRFVGGCRVGRDTVAALREAGFEIERLDRLDGADTGLSFPAAPQVLGVARSPA